MQFANQADQDKFNIWFREKLEHIAQYIFKKKIINTEINVESRWIIPHNVLLGQAQPKDEENNIYWVITGEAVPTDHAELTVAETPRDAARYFAMRWQLQAARVQTAETSDLEEKSDNRVDWNAMGESLATKAEMLYALVEDDRNWQGGMH